MNIFKKIKAEIVYSLAVRKADNAHSENGDRYYVIPSEDGRLVVVDRRNFRVLKRKNYIPKDASVADMQRECFYCTPYRNGKGEMPADIIALKHSAFLDWFAKR